ncbi:MAG TPA: BadF/BadG/BcrA/BcrD ATPase family protein [Dongiaceae bacterium]|nr:BadF/BadG/BcrA/BcrD ATPase family protein [Dongiaceae bacterium]
MPFVCGLDSGGTKTLLALADRTGTVLGPTRSASLDPSKNVDWPAVLATAIAQATSPIDGVGAIEAAAFGLSFHGEIAEISQRQKAVAEELLPGCASHGRLIVENDVRIAFDGAFAAEDGVSVGGVLVLAGTGSMVWASRNGAHDPHLRIGGWGDAFGDEGSAFWIGREALGLASRTLDGRARAPALTQAVLNAIGVRASEMLAWCYQLPDRRARFAMLAPAIGGLAEQGDTDALQIIKGAADHLAAHALAARRQLDLPASSAWSYAGSVFNCRLLIDLLTQRLGNEPTPPRLPPIGGALIRAARLAGWRVDRNWIDRIARSLASA